MVVTPVTEELRKQKQEGHMFHSYLSYLARQSQRKADRRG